MFAFASEHHGIRGCGIGIGIGDQQLGYWGIGGWGSEDKEIGVSAVWGIGRSAIRIFGGLGNLDIGRWGTGDRRIRYCEIGDRG